MASAGPFEHRQLRPRQALTAADRSCRPVLDDGERVRADDWRVRRVPLAVRLGSERPNESSLPSW
jgi:hypothetical protein